MLTAQVKPISYLKSHAASIANDIAESGEPLLITQNGEARLVVMDVHAYERQQETFALLKLLALGQRDIDAGRLRDADEVFADLEKDDAA
ncbi:MULTISPECIES: type II toxin-antitoxin system Phd/YefM family antitoxin [unclassified Roseateles]|uniref:type II toxin-antitoxin system Phd/YefM family antitoxin n=1 Tax=unclassified Roseateles TaxID=2626991 RepID=UPI0006FFE021|nr:MULTISPECIES: type II toxin-antitoxin system Phd/YefM family antitoxin [unclassified Roseateles]KQW41223.1 prevent-host-death protein [Pelomonas sp. Root405]KRA67995.1 prevent-host-death protein [Pelomonas sp. Root662]